MEFSLVNYNNAVKTQTGIFYSNSTDILYSVDDATSSRSVYKKLGGFIIGLVVDPKNNKLFWSDSAVEQKGIYSADLKVTSNQLTLINVKKIISDVSVVESIDVNGNSKNIYWTDSARRKINVASYDGRLRREFPIYNLLSPRGLFTDLKEGYLYWTDSVRSVVERSRLDGSKREIVVSSLNIIKNPNGIFIAKKFIYIVSGWSNLLVKLSTSGKILSKILLPENPAFDLIIDSDFAYVTVSNVGLIKVDLLKSTYSTVSDHYGSNFGITTQLQKDESSSLSRLCNPGKHKCSHICLLTSSSTYRCSCPSTGGKVLDKKKSKCIDPTTVLIFASADQGEIGYIDPDNPLERYIISKSVRPVALTFDKEEKMVYWSDIVERVVLRAHLSGQNREVVLTSDKHSIGIVDGLAFDNSDKRLYFTNRANINMEKYGSRKLYRIESVSTNGDKQLTISRKITNPIAIFLYKDQLYYTGRNHQGRLMKSNKDGSNSTTVFSNTTFNNPNGIFIENSGRIFIIDSNYSATTKWHTGSVYFLTISNGSKAILKGITKLKLKAPLGLTGNGNGVLYVSDWDSRSIERIELDKNGYLKEQSTVLKNITQPMGALYINMKSKPIQDTSCTLKNCDICLKIDTKNTKRCYCDGYNTKLLSTDKSSCKESEDFIVFADKSSIILSSLRETSKPHYIIRGNPVLSSYSAVAVVKDTYYFTDLQRGSLQSTNMTSKQSEVLISKGTLIKQIIVTADGKGLFCADSLNHRILFIDLVTKQKKTFVDLVKDPESLTIDSSGNYLYYTEHRKESNIWKVSLKDDKPTPTLVYQKAFHDPRGLCFDGDDLILVENNNFHKFWNCSSSIKIGCRQVKLTEKLANITSIACMNRESILYFSTQTPPSIQSLNLSTGKTKTIVKYLIGPNQISIKVTHTKCGVNHKCTDICKNVLGEEVCSCRGGRHLLDDGSTCVDKANWEEKPWKFCVKNCTKQNTVCGRIIDKQISSCICKPGYTSSGNGNCIKCQKNEFKSKPGPDVCSPCPAGSTDSSDRISCSCTSGKYWLKEIEDCTDRIGNCPSEGKVNCSNKECEKDDDCPPLQKCCLGSSCGKRCADGVKSKFGCLHNGNIYKQSEMFKIDHCTICTCTSSGHSSYYETKCKTQKCLPLNCDKSIKKEGQCCPECLDDKGKMHFNTHFQIKYDDFRGILVKFINCPTETKEINTEKGKNYAILKSFLRATSLGKSLNVNVSPDVGHLVWNRNAYRFMATSNKAICHFRVLVVGKPTLRFRP
ncbi:DgyrCDS6543 [Dimorphilus gyrociliatus]|uniref:DgyrCDS6543 n=1 Tax=Dimorphilus gyrociliatus TaxID=2664684 RepID=A0A7I8VNH2_9ANNE|nr:DgyrCDS6543 [Dimorphilus gyrociliatus]